MASLAFWILALLFVICVLPNSALAFGAGNLPSYGFLEGKAFRHGDIEDVLAELLKRTGTGLLNRGSKFGGLDIKRVYFGNWLRDYSQAVDVAGLKSTTLQNILSIVMVLGFLAHGYVTDEFEVTEERLGVYLPVQHIDNPKGYGEAEDPKRYHPKLRARCDPRELEIDLRTGMKNYIANDDGGWDTSKAYVRRTLDECIRLGRQYRATNKKVDQYEAFRLLGTALHTLEDFSAHSNFCELALISLGHQQVFCHVGDQVRIRAPNGRMVAPLVTGTFGGDDFIHSLLGEAGDHISQASISDLNSEIEKAKAKSSSKGTGNITTIKNLLSSVPSTESQGMQRDVDSMAAPPAKDPKTMSPQELYQNIWGILRFRDALVKKIEFVIEKIPGLGPLIENIMENITVFVFTTLEPYLKPLMQIATVQLSDASKQVINSHDQFETFSDPYASDPTHSMLSKDHFNLILNEPAGNLAKIIVIHVVKAVITAWDNPNTPAYHVTEMAMECLFHPDFHNPHSAVQKEMLSYMQKWITTQTAGQYDVLNRLTKDSVRSHRNVREGRDGSGASVSASTHGHGASVHQGSGVQGMIGGAVGKIPGVAQAGQVMGKLGLNTPFPIGHNAGVKREGEAASYYQPTQPSSHGGDYSPPATSYMSFQSGGHASYVPSGPEPGYGAPMPQPSSGYSHGVPAHPPTSAPHYAPSGGPQFPTSTPQYAASGGPQFPTGAPQYPPAHGGKHKKKDSDSDDSDDSDKHKKKDKKKKDKDKDKKKHGDQGSSYAGGYPGATRREEHSTSGYAPSYGAPAPHAGYGMPHGQPSSPPPAPNAGFPSPGFPGGGSYAPAYAAPGPGFPNAPGSYGPGSGPGGPGSYAPGGYSMPAVPGQPGYGAPAPGPAFPGGPSFPQGPGFPPGPGYGNQPPPYGGGY